MANKEKEKIAENLLNELCGFVDFPCGAMPCEICPIGNIKNIEKAVYKKYKKFANDPC